MLLIKNKQKQDTYTEINLNKTTKMKLDFRGVVTDIRGASCESR